MSWQAYRDEVIGPASCIRSSAWREGAPRILQVLVEQAWIEYDSLTSQYLFGVKVPHVTSTVYGGVPIGEDARAGLVEGDEVVVNVKTLFTILYLHLPIPGMTTVNVFLAKRDKRGHTSKLQVYSLDLDQLTMEPFAGTVSLSPLVTGILTPARVSLLCRSLFPSEQHCARLEADLGLRVQEYYGTLDLKLETVFHPPQDPPHAVQEQPANLFHGSLSAHIPMASQPSALRNRTQRSLLAGQLSNDFFRDLLIENLANSDDNVYLSILSAVRSLDLSHLITILGGDLSLAMAIDGYSQHTISVATSFPCNIGAQTLNGLQHEVFKSGSLLLRQNPHLFQNPADTFSNGIYNLILTMLPGLDVIDDGTLQDLYPNLSSLTLDERSSLLSGTKSDTDSCPLLRALSIIVENVRERLDWILAFGGQGTSPRFSQELVGMLQDLFAIRTNCFFMQEVVFVTYDCNDPTASIVASGLRSTSAIQYIPLPYLGGSVSERGIAQLLGLIGMYKELLYRLLQPDGLLSFSEDDDIYDIVIESPDGLRTYEGGTTLIEKTNIHALRTHLNGLINRMITSSDALSTHPSHRRTQAQVQSQTSKQGLRLPLHQLIQNLGYSTTGHSDDDQQIRTVVQEGLDVLYIPTSAAAAHPYFRILHLGTGTDPALGALLGGLSMHGKNVWNFNDTEPVIITSTGHHLLSQLVLSVVKLLQTCAQLCHIELTSGQAAIFLPIPLPDPIHAPLFEAASDTTARGLFMSLLARETSCIRRGSIHDVIRNVDTTYADTFGSSRWLALIQNYVYGVGEWVYRSLTGETGGGNVRDRPSDTYDQSTTVLDMTRTPTTPFSGSYARARRNLRTDLEETTIRDVGEYGDNVDPQLRVTRSTQDQVVVKVLKVLEAAINSEVSAYVTAKDVLCHSPMRIMGSVITKMPTKEPAPCLSTLLNHHPPVIREAVSLIRRPIGRTLFEASVGPDNTLESSNMEQDLNSEKKSSQDQNPQGKPPHLWQAVGPTSLTAWCTIFLYRCGSGPYGVDSLREWPISIVVDNTTLKSEHGSRRTLSRGSWIHNKLDGFEVVATIPLVDKHSEGNLVSLTTQPLEIRRNADELITCSPYVSNPSEVLRWYLYELSLQSGLPRSRFLWQSDLNLVQPSIAADPSELNIGHLSGARTPPVPDMGDESVVTEFMVAHPESVTPRLHCSVSIAPQTPAPTTESMRTTKRRAHTHTLRRTTVRRGTEEVTGEDLVDFAPSTTPDILFRGTSEYAAYKHRIQGYIGVDQAEERLILHLPPIIQPYVTLPSRKGRRGDPKYTRVQATSPRPFEIVVDHAEFSVLVSGIQVAREIDEVVLLGSFNDDAEA
ncbi:hypothetical protein GMRT_11699 [Giardia muris]|uniref:Uncharacterized protein n=1 Tax=Giardia muris TaxID=5742 RepID=A0A4Z1T1A0_GIAMU|nr:hypothetical protein GMRT_11699 [Giardia muris]|eukprot:TNJ26707.1 hypothetical protein GMRT_11699 [Giardia muris]